MTADLAARIAETAAFIESQLAQDEATAKAAIESRGQWYDPRPGPPSGAWKMRNRTSVVESDAGVIVFDEGCPTGEQAAHIARQDPARTLRRVKAVRGLVAAILAGPHDYVPDEYYSCSQAAAGTGRVNPDPEDLVPGSGCLDPERKGQPCDCGRDARVARLLDIIAGEWRET